MVVVEKVQLPQTLHSLIRNEITAQTAVTVTTHQILTGVGSVTTTFAAREIQPPPDVFHLARLAIGRSTL